MERMTQTKKLKYCEKTTREHYLYKVHNGSCVYDINYIAEREKTTKKLTDDQLKALVKKRRYFPECQVIDLDKIEKLNNKGGEGELKSTVDIVFGCSDITDSGKSNNPCLVLVDFKYNVKSTTLNDIKGYKKKYKDSLTIINKDIPIHPKCYFVFNDDVYQQAKSRFSRLNNGIADIKKYTYVPLNNKEFLEKFFL